VIVRVLLPNRPRALLLRGGWASKRFLVVVRGHPSVLLTRCDDDDSRLGAISRDLPSFLSRLGPAWSVVIALQQSFSNVTGM
jgi:hypothetical protein